MGLKRCAKRNVIIGAMIFFVSFTLVYSAVLTKDMRQKLENIKTASEVYDRNGKLIGNLYYYRRIWIPIQKIPLNLQNAVVAIEDARFYKHNGIDIKGMARAVIRDILPGGGVEGGSTITQQLAKIALLSSERTLSRKIQDISYALDIEQVYTKKEILELYLNSVYLAHGNVGIEAASRYYFNKSANELTLDQCALLAGVIRSPENYSPLKHEKEAKERRNLVLQKMLEQNYITKQQYRTATAKGLNVVNQGETASVGAYFLNYIRDYLVKNLGYSEEDLRLQGYKIHTTLNLDYQREAERALQGIPDVTAKIQPQASLVTVDPATGEILAMVGGRDYAKSQLNRSVSAYRQPGSAVKPFVYAAAIDKGYTAASIVEDKPLDITLTSGDQWKPDNYDHIFRGPLTLREALRQSVNSVAIQLLQAVGVDTVADEMEHMGITSLVRSGGTNDLNLAPLALGGLTKGVTPLELALAYAPFASQGNAVKPFAIQKIYDRHNNLLKQFNINPPQPVLSPQTAYVMTMLMKDVVDQGTGIRAKLPDRPAAGKTGTTSDYTNAWFVGYTPDLLTAVWIGNDRQELHMQYKEGNIGSGTAAEIWGSYMKRITANRPAVDFMEPDGIIWANVNPKTGQAVPGWLSGSGGYKEVFIDKNVPESPAYKIWHWLFPERKKASVPSAVPPEKTPGQDILQNQPESIPGQDELGAAPLPTPAPTEQADNGTLDF